MKAVLQRADLWTWGWFSELGLNNIIADCRMGHSLFKLLGPWRGEELPTRIQKSWLAPLVQSSVSVLPVLCTSGDGQGPRQRGWHLASWNWITLAGLSELNHTSLMQEMDVWQKVTISASHRQGRRRKTSAPAASFTIGCWRSFQTRVKKMWVCLLSRVRPQTTNKHTEIY